MNDLEILRKILAFLVVFLLAALAIVTLLLLINQGGGYLQSTRDSEISATLSDPYISAQPHGRRITTVQRGQQVFFNIVTRRPEGCFIDTDWRFARVDSPGSHTVWMVDGARTFAPAAGKDLISQAVTVPSMLIPGTYKLTRLTGWQCGSASDPAMNVIILDLTVTS